MNKNNKYSNRFRRISHPRNNLTLCDEYIEHLRGNGKKVPAVSQGAVHTELLNYFDPYDVGLDFGDKQIKHILKRESANNLFFRWRKKPEKYSIDTETRKAWNRYRESKFKDINNFKFNANKVYEHITQKKKWYWTGNPFCSERVLGVDVDNKTDDPKSVLPFLRFFQSYYPKTFYDHGSSGKSLHYYPKIDMLPLYEYYSKNTAISGEWANYANKIIKYTGRIFKIFGRNILCPEHTLVLKTRKNGSTYFRPEYHVEFDAFKGTYPEYDCYVNKEEKIVITEMTKNGNLHKYPNIFTVEDLITFRDAPVFSIIYHLSFSLYLCNQLFLSGCYSDRDMKVLTKAQKEIIPILEEHSVLFPCQEKNDVSLNDTPNITIPEREDNNKLCIYTGTFENVADIAMESDVLIRSRRYLYYCYMEYILKEGREPTKEEYRQNYRTDVGTGTEDEEDIKRLNYVYDTNIEKMRKYTYGSLSQKIEHMEQKLGLSQDDLNRMKRYDGNIYLREMAITAVWIELCLTNSDYLTKKEWYNLNKAQYFSRELTVPMTSLENFIKCLKQKGLNKNGCNPKKAKVLRELLIGINWMQCVDDTVVIAAHNGGNGGRARRYILLSDHPGYQRFESIVGPDRIEYWKRFREEQIRSRTAKGVRVA